MTLESQVVSLELAKQLNEAGYPQDESLFYWIDFGLMGDEWSLMIKQTDGSYSDMKGGWGRLADDQVIVAAPTVAELGEQLPHWIQKERLDYNLTIDWLGDGVAADYSNNNKVIDILRKEDKSIGDKHLHREQADTEANARAKMWLYLKKEGLL